MKSKTNTQCIAGTVYVRVPPHMVEYLNLSKEESVQLIIQDDNGKYGKFISIWKEEE